MFIFKEGQRAYLTAWEFNTCRMLGELAKIVENNGGKVAQYPHVMATNRQYAPDAEPLRIYGRGYIRFNLDGVQYYWQVDDNPFFGHYYTKVRIHDGKVPCGNEREGDRKVRGGCTQLRPLPAGGGKVLRRA